MEKYIDIKSEGCIVRCKLYYGEPLHRGNESAGESEEAGQNSRVPKKAVVFCTGFAGHKDNNAAAGYAEKLLSKHKDVLVLVFNWPAHGDDVKKKLVLSDCMVYLELVIRELRTHFGAEELYAYATSFGGYLVLKYISEHGNPFRKIALRCPAVDMYDVLTRTIMQGDEYDKILKGKEALVGFDRKILVTPALLEDLKENDIRTRDFLDFAEDILIMHGTSDEVVPFESAREFADNNLIEFVPVEKADHRFRNPPHMSLANKLAMEFFGLG